MPGVAWCFIQVKVFMIYSYEPMSQIGTTAPQSLDTNHTILPAHFRPKLCWMFLCNIAQEVMLFGEVSVEQLVQLGVKESCN